MTLELRDCDLESHFLTSLLVTRPLQVDQHQLLDGLCIEKTCGSNETGPFRITGLKRTSEHTFLVAYAIWHIPYALWLHLLQVAVYCGSKKPHSVMDRDVSCSVHEVVWEVGQNQKALPLATSSEMWLKLRWEPVTQLTCLEYLQHGGWACALGNACIL